MSGVTKTIGVTFSSAEAKEHVQKAAEKERMSANQFISRAAEKEAIRTCPSIRDIDSNTYNNFIDDLIEIGANPKDAREYAALKLGELANNSNNITFGGNKLK